MKPSFSYKLILLILKIKGIKKDFSKDPIDYKKIRKEDIHTPKGKFFNSKFIRSFRIEKTKITEITKEEITNKLVIFIHGGAFISGPSKLHWDTAKYISTHTNHTVWMIDYPKAPENKIDSISYNIDKVYEEALKTYKASDIALIGDSVGGTLSTTLVQRLIKDKKEIPGKLILVSPVMDSSLTNPKIEAIDKTDPMLGKIGILSAKRLCAGTIELKNPIISPLYGSFNDFPATLFFLAENDITFPDQQLAVQKIEKTNTVLTAIIGKNMPHVWPFLPVLKEAKIALNEIVLQLNK